MKTPRTEAVVRMAVGPMREYAIIEHAQNLELENAAFSLENARLREVLGKMIKLASTGEMVVNPFAPMTLKL